MTDDAFIGVLDGNRADDPIDRRLVTLPRGNERPRLSETILPVVVSIVLFAVLAFLAVSIGPSLVEGLRDLVRDPGAVFGDLINLLTRP